MYKYCTGVVSKDFFLYPNVDKVKPRRRASRANSTLALLDPHESWPSVSSSIPQTGLRWRRWRATATAVCRAAAMLVPPPATRDRMAERACSLPIGESASALIRALYECLKG